jgi:glycerophosphoryl diester phosphodiesterase
LAAIRRACGAPLTTALGWRALTALIVAARTGVRPSRGVATGSFAHVSLRYGRVPVLADPRITGRLVQMAADLGLGVVAWTVNDVPTIRRLADAGVAGLITDRPDVLRETLVAAARE